MVRLFTMQVTDTFHFRNGTTIFVGHVTTTANRIPTVCSGFIVRSVD
jgi:hypothetical protein